MSIADLGGTEIDVRFEGKGEGQVVMVVAPVLRFIDAGYNADVRIEDVGEPQKLIEGFAPEILGRPVEEEDVIDQFNATAATPTGDVTTYNWEIKPHVLVSATAYGNRVFLLAVKASALQWRKNEANLRKTATSLGIFA